MTKAEGKKYNLKIIKASSKFVNRHKREHQSRWKKNEKEMSYHKTEDGNPEKSNERSPIKRYETIQKMYREKARIKAPDHKPPKYYMDINKKKEYDTEVPTCPQEELQSSPSWILPLAWK